MPHIVALLTNPFLQGLLKPAHVTQGIISDARVSHMKTNEFFTSKQLVFKGRSATFQLLNVLTNGLLDADDISIDILDTDIQKAFDNIPYLNI